jgi:hypothetical protein
MHPGDGNESGTVEMADAVLFFLRSHEHLVLGVKLNVHSITLRSGRRRLKRGFNLIWNPLNQLEERFRRLIRRVSALLPIA